MGKEYPADEAAQYGQEIDAISRKFRADVTNILTDAASRGFPAPPGQALELIVATGLAAKTKAVETNAKVFQTMTERRLKEEEVDQKVMVGLARLDLELLKADYDNLHEIAKAMQDMTLDEQRAAVQKLQSDVDKRQAYVIEERALIEREVTYWKRQAIQAEGIALDAEVQLAREKVKTAEEKLRIVEYLYQVIAAEQRVIAAEIHRAEVLETVIARQEQVAEIKKTMIPLYEDKAEARLRDAEAIKEEAEVKKEIEELGYRRIDLKRAQEDADHQVRQAEEGYEEARYAYFKAERTTELMRAEARTMLTEFEALIKEKLIKMKKALDKEERRFKLDQRLYWEQYGWTQEFDYNELQRLRLMKDIPEKIQNLIKTALEKFNAAKAGRRVTTVRNSYAAMHQFISKGT